MSEQAAYRLLRLFFKSQSVLIPLLLLFRKRSRSRRLLACRRACDGSLSLPTFCGGAGQLHLFRSTLPRRSKVRFAPAYFFVKISHQPAFLLLLFRKKSCSAHLLGCGGFSSRLRPHNGSLSLPTFCELQEFNSTSRYAKISFL